MGSDDDSTVIHDWVNLPDGTTAVSLWDCLHDARLISLSSNLLERTLSLVCQIEHLSSFYQMHEGVQFVLKLEGVQSARVIRSAIWPGGCSVPNGVSREEESRIIAEYQSKWREESASWNEFEIAVSREDKDVFYISNATLATSPHDVLAIRVDGQLGSGPRNNYAAYHEFFVRAGRLEVSTSEGKQLELHDFLELGRKYWAQR
jgi:hypothetical protein